MRLAKRGNYQGIREFFVGETAGVRVGDPRHGWHDRPKIFSACVDLLAQIVARYVASQWRSGFQLHFFNDADSVADPYCIYKTQAVPVFTNALATQHPTSEIAK